jgi:hypothetical protein
LSLGYLVIRFKTPFANMDATKSSCVQAQGKAYIINFLRA